MITPEVVALLKKAEENINAVELLLNQGFYHIAVSRSYYAMFYCAEAILLTKNLSYSSHQAVISFFNKEFVRTGIFDKKFHKALYDAFKSWQEADYEPIHEFTKEEAENYLVLAKEFLEAARRYLGEVK